MGYVGAAALSNGLSLGEVLKHHFQTTLELGRYLTAGPFWSCRTFGAELRSTILEGTCGAVIWAAEYYSITMPPAGLPQEVFLYRIENFDASFIGLRWN